MTHNSKQKGGWILPALFIFESAAGDLITKKWLFIVKGVVPYREGFVL
jgi:hypothetical protein